MRASLTKNGSPDWRSNYLIGIAPIGNQIEVDLFTNPSTGKDQSTPYERYIYNYRNP